MMGGFAYVKNYGLRFFISNNIWNIKNKFGQQYSVVQNEQQFCTKTIEMRLFDEKRSLISTGDTIIFTDTSNKEKIDCMVINMYRYLSFEELYQHHSKVSIGYNKDEIANPKEMLMYYSKEMIEKYGVVAIEIKVL